MYLTYTNYKALGGELNEATFNIYEFQAESLIDWYTFNRLKTGAFSVPTSITKCMFVLISILERQAAALGISMNGSAAPTGTITSQSNDGVAISYSTVASGQLMSSIKEEAVAVINQTLSGVVNELGRKLLYRGLYPGE